MTHTIVVVPCFNEELRLPAKSFIAFVADHPEVEFLMVNDGSSDRTLELLTQLQADLPDNIRILNLSQNLGKAEAVRRGCCQALERDPRFVGYWDADLAAPLEAIPQFQDVLSRHPGIQLVIGSRLPLLGHAIERCLVRCLLGRVFAGCAAAVLGLPIYDTQCGHKLFRVSPELREIFEVPFHARWIFDVELLARWIGRRRRCNLQRAQITIYELPLEKWRDVAGSKLKSLDFFQAFFELVTIGWVFLSGRLQPKPTLSAPVEVPDVIPFPMAPVQPAATRRAA